MHDVVIMGYEVGLRGDRAVPEQPLADLEAEPARSSIVQVCREGWWQCRPNTPAYFPTSSTSRETASDPKPRCDALINEYCNAA